VKLSDVAIREKGSQLRGRAFPVDFTWEASYGLG
jgi:hypothetical protein